MIKKGSTAGLARNDVVDMLKVLAHPVRLGVLTALKKSAADQGDNPPGQFAGVNAGAFETLGLAQSTTSAHLQKLRFAGLVSTKRRGNEIIYLRNEERIAELKRFLLTEL